MMQGHDTGTEVYGTKGKVRLHVAECVFVALP